MLNGKSAAEAKDIIATKVDKTETPLVRIAGPADESEIYRLLLLAHAEISIFTHSNERVVWYVKRFLNGNRLHPNDTGPRGVFGVIGPVGSLVALTMVGIGQYWYTDTQHLEEYLVFVDPGHRANPIRYGVALIDWLKEQSRTTRLPLLTGILSNHRTEAKCRLYDRHLPCIGKYYYYNPHTIEGLPVMNADFVTGPGTQVRRGLTELSSLAN